MFQNRLIPEGMQEVIQKVVAEQHKLKSKTDSKMGPATELTCSCGGVLHERVRSSLPPKVIPGPRRSKNRRIAKKQRKRWAQQYGIMLLGLHTIMTVSRPAGYLCAACRRHVGFYEAIGRNMFKIEPLPHPGEVLHESIP